ncbi:helix-turn-helix domain-containing protein [Aquibium oceanicum]|uniref:HTH araC/xylS-type domain-containing protein n=1 Tax=Aquibium oceanicum TaxID=1670800 RepID=A0A1L3SZ60_9HYPH|nr:helix-turn-helix domain-containing protein [Aquibium oceanicum]APH74678.1 hypothetical protein BSQ44_17760 [Aquibium oceanicum]
MNRPVPNYQLYGETPDRGGEFWLHCETIPERSRLHEWEIRPHRHPAFFQMLYISDGSGEVLADGGYLPMARSTAVLMPPGAVHGFRFSRDIGGLVVTVLRERLDALCAASSDVAAFAASPRVIAQADARAPEAVTSLRRIEAELAGRGIARMVLLDALVTSAVIELARTGGSADVTSGEQDRDQARLDELAALIGAHYREHRPVAFYAEKIGVSATHLNRIARARTGHSLQGLVDLRLMEEARRNLVFTFLPAQTIALDLGFSDPAYFSRFFRRQAGETPAAFRARERARLRF